MKQFILVDEKGEILPFTVTDSEIVDPGSLTARLFTMEIMIRL